MATFRCHFHYLRLNQLKINHIFYKGVFWSINSIQIEVKLGHQFQLKEIKFLKVLERNTFIKSLWSFFFIDFLKAVNYSIILWIEEWLIDESNFYNFKWLHCKDLNPTGYTPRKEILKNINQLAHISVSQLISI